MEKIAVPIIFANSCVESHNITTTFNNQENLIYTASNYITAECHIQYGANITCDATNYVRLKAGFKVDLGTQFFVKIGGCNQ